MSSTDLDALPLKSILIAIAVVLGLHVLTAVALVAVKTPELKIEPEKVTPTIEIELVTIPVEKIPPEIKLQEEISAKKEVEPQEQKAVKPKPEPKSKVEPKPTPTVKPKPKALEKPIIKDRKTDTATIVEQEQKKPVIIKKVLPKKPVVESKVDTSVADTLIADNQRRDAERRRILAVEAQKAAQAAHAQAVEAQRLADAQAAREAQANADAKAAKAAAQKAAEMDAAKKAAEAAAQAASNQPVSFSGKDAAWIVAPNFEGISDKVQTLTLRFTVTKQGNIENININGAKNIKIDREVSRRLKRAKLKPFIQNGAPVVGVVTLSIEVRP